ncbi:MAG: monovalent cation/H(+) antiporter subunit G [Hyphomicrobiaceae bacterium]
MIEFPLAVLSGFLIVSGGFFVLVGAVGLVRMPDVFTRMHAASVIETAGGGLLLVGLMLRVGFDLVTLKLLFLLFVFFMTAPVATHALAQAALQAGVEPILSEDRRDALTGDPKAHDAKADGTQSTASTSASDPLTAKTSSSENASDRSAETE